MLFLITCSVLKEQAMESFALFKPSDVLFCSVLVHAVGSSGFDVVICKSRTAGHLFERASMRCKNEHLRDSCLHFL